MPSHYTPYGSVQHTLYINDKPQSLSLNHLKARN